MASKYKWEGIQFPPLSELWRSGQSLGEKIETMLTRFIQRVILWCVDFLSDRLVDIFDNSMKIMRPGTERATRDMFKYFKTMEGAPDWFTKAMESAETEEGESSFILKAVVFFAGIRAILIGGIQPISNFVNYNAERKFRSHLPDINTAAFMHRVGLMSDEGFTNTMEQLGVHEKLIPVYKDLSRRMTSPQEKTVGLWRGVVSGGDFSADLRRMGYDQKDIDLYTELAKQIPPISDLIRMLVRDAFNDGVSSQFGYDEDFPQDINQYFEKQGYDPDWAKRYWRSHWTLPSPTQAYEMLHRKLITLEDIETLLKTSDYPPFWREKLIAISYNVMTRVDVRRLLQSGLIDAGKAEQVYNDMGYTPEDAKLLTEFAVMGISQDERDLTKTDVLNLYEEGVIDRDTTSANLVKMGYDALEAEDILKLADVNIAKAQRTDLINYTKEKFIARQLDIDGARGELTQIGLKSSSVERYIMNWQRAQEGDVALPTMADVKRWYIDDRIDETKARSLLKLHKHTNEHIEIYVKEWNDLKTEATDEQA